MAWPAVTLTHVVKTFKNVTAVDDLSIEVRDREFAVFVGPSGCGKTTALRMIAGLEPVSSGEIRIGERVVNDVEPKDRDIAMVFQNYALYPHMNVRENLGFGLKMRKFQKTEIDSRVEEAADILGIQPLLERKPRELSGGQRQRVALGRAIVRKPAVFLFDEPLSNLDAKLRVAMRAEISKLHKRLGATIVYVTHDQVEAMTMADRIFVMNKGALQQSGDPLEVYKQPGQPLRGRLHRLPGHELPRGRPGRRGANPSSSRPKVHPHCACRRPSPSAWPPMRAGPWSSGCAPKTCSCRGARQAGSPRLHGPGRGGGEARGRGLHPPLLRPPRHGGPHGDPGSSRGRRPGRDAWRPDGQDPSVRCPEPGANHRVTGGPGRIRPKP